MNFYNFHIDFTINLVLKSCELKQQQCFVILTNWFESADLLVLFFAAGSVINLVLGRKIVNNVTSFLNTLRFLNKKRSKNEFEE